MKNYLSIASIVGITVAIIGLLIGIFVAIFFLQERHPLYFEDQYGTSVVGDVYLNEVYLGKTVNGKVFIEKFTTGEVKIITYKNGEEYRNYFEIYPDDKDYDLVFNVEFTDDDKVNLVKENEYYDYVGAIEYDNEELRAEATKATEGCYSGEKECQIVSIYEYVLSEYKYFSDARNDEHIQSPAQTKQFKGGDCEDLSILLNSFLENIGVETYMAFTEDHAYSLACDVDPELISDNVLAYFYGSELIDDSTTVIDMGESETWYYGGDETFNGKDVNNIIGEINSDIPIIVFAVDDEEEYQNFLNDYEFDVVEGSYYEDVTNLNFNFNMLNTGGLVIYNPNYGTATIDLDMEVYVNYVAVDLDDFEITTYEVDGKTCVPMDPSAGEMSYVGYDSVEDEEVTLVNTLTGEIYG